MTCVIPDLPVQRKRTYSSPIANFGEPEKFCAIPRAVPPGVATSTTDCETPFHCSVTATLQCVKITEPRNSPAQLCMRPRTMEVDFLAMSFRLRYSNVAA